MGTKKVSIKPKRINLAMSDPIIGPGATKTAVAPVTVAPAGLQCTAELFLGPDENTKAASSGPVAFTSTGEQQEISLPVVMPTAGGVAYHVYLDIIAEGYLLVAFIATEDVIIPSGTVGPIEWE